MICFKFINAMSDTTIINSFNNNNSNISRIKTQHRQIMGTITNGILNLSP